MSNAQIIPVRAALLELARANPLVPILRGSTAERLRPVATALVAGGARLIELTATTPGAFAALTVMRRELPQDVLIGMGTIRSSSDARRAEDAGADYLVLPAVLPTAATATNLPIAVGAWTPTEVLTAWELQPAVVKLFPASDGGVTHLKALREIYPEIPFMPTGGVTADTAVDYLQAGAVAVGLAGDLVRPALEGGDLTALTNTVTELLSRLRVAKP